jgi:Flp pilus assembly protein TadG
MPSLAASTASVRTTLRRFRRSRRASAAVEFALIAPPFIGLLFAIIETAIMFFAGQVLESATQDAARMVLTGQAQSLGYDQGKFKSNVVCSASGVANVLFSDCANPNGVYVDVQSYPSFNNVTISNQIDANGNFINNMKYCLGNGGDIVVVRLFYQWPLIITGLGYNIANLSGSKRLLTATAAFRNEPFGPNSVPCS